MRTVHTNQDRREIDALLRAVYSTKRRRKNLSRRMLKKAGQTVFMTAVVLVPLWFYLFVHPEFDHVSVLHDLFVVAFLVCLALYQCLGLFIFPFAFDEIWKPPRPQHRPVR